MFQFFRADLQNLLLTHCIKLHNEPSKTCQIWSHSLLSNYSFCAKWPPVFTDGNGKTVNSSDGS